jgi:hypothetical protein
MKQILILLALSLTVACVKTPPTLTPDAAIAFKGLQAVRALDLLRDTAIAANDQKPPVITEEATRKIIMYHRSMVTIIQAMPTGWKVAVDTGLTELVKHLSPPDKARLAPYVSLIKAVIAEVQ